MNYEFMLKAIEAAKTTCSDIPVGAVVVKNNEIIAIGVNEKEKYQNTINHAEIVAIQKANQILKNWRLNDCEMYVTLEPCPMCAGAIIQSRIKALYFGAYDMLTGAMGSKIDMSNIMAAKIEVKGGILEEQCTKLLTDYFKNIRHIETEKIFKNV